MAESHREDDGVTRPFRRRLYRYALASLTCWLMGILAFDIEDVGIDPVQFSWTSYLLTFSGVVLAFKTLDIWSSWLEDSSEEQDEDRPSRNLYPLLFTLEGGAVLLLAIFLLLVAIARDWPTGQEGLICAWSLIVAGGCLLTSRLSEGLG
jgi:peptidoglycan/LPS O-acetylase OafA/YrhL